MISTTATQQCLHFLKLHCDLISTPVILTKKGDNTPKHDVALGNLQAVT